MVSDRDRTKMRRLADDLAEDTWQEHGSPEQRADVLAMINETRARRGLDQLSDRAPEEGFYDRAKSLGMARVDR